MDHCARVILALVFLKSTFCFRGTNVSVFVSEGQDCELPCSGLKGVRILVLEWIELDLRRDLLVYRAGRVQDGYEHPDFTNRVQLLDPHLQHRNFSVMLKNVTLKDCGTYECQALYEDDQKIPQFIRLNVTEREPETPTPTTGTEPTEGLGTGGVIAIVIGLIVVMGLSLLIVLYQKQSKCSQFSSCESDLEKSLPPSSGSNTSFSTTSSNLSNESCTKPLIKDFSSPSPRET